MAGYPVQRRRPPVIMREAARRRARDSGTLSVQSVDAARDAPYSEDCLKSTARAARATDLAPGAFLTVRAR